MLADKQTLETNFHTSPEFEMTDLGREIAKRFKNETEAEATTKL